MKPEAEMKPQIGFKQASRAEQRRAEKKQQSAAPNGCKSLLAKQNLNLSDLQKTERLLRLANMLGGDFTTDQGKRRIVGAAEHVLHQMQAKSVKSPIGMFVAIVSDGRWKDLTDDQLEKANDRIKRHEHPSGLASTAAELLASKTNGRYPPE